MFSLIFLIRRIKSGKRFKKERIASSPSQKDVVAEENNSPHCNRRSTVRRSKISNEYFYKLSFIVVFYTPNRCVCEFEMEKDRIAQSEKCGIDYEMSPAG